MNDPKPIFERIPDSLPVSPWSVIAAIFLLVAATMTFYTIPADSEGIVLRFGKYIDKVPSGLHMKLPFGIDMVIPVPTQRQQKLEFGFYTPGFTNLDQVGGEPEKEKSMVTGDLNSALVEWIVQYRITDPDEYLFDVRGPDQTLRDLSEAAMREVIGDRTVDEIITIGREEIEERVLLRLRELTKLYHLGFTINQVQLKNVNPPLPVQPSFNEVNRAQQDNLANGEYNKAVPRVRGEADQRVRAAEGYRYKRVNEAEGDVSAFNQVLAQYLKSPDITRIRIYLETLGDVLPQTKQQIIVDEGVQEIMPMLPFQSKLPEVEK